MRSIFLLLLASSLCPLQGCCSLARLFCGPDKSEWISERYDTPRRTVQTLFEAIRRDDAEVVYLCLSKAYRVRLGVAGLEFQILWQRLRDEVPGLFVAGYADIPEPELTSADRAAVNVDVEGRCIRVELVRQVYQELRYRLPGKPPSEQGRIVPTFDLCAKIESEPVSAEADDAHSVLLVAPFPFDHSADVDVPLDSIEHAAMTRRWKVDNVRMQ